MLLPHIHIRSQIPELRAVFLLIGTIYGCALDGEKYPGRVESACLTGGQGYIDMCGPRELATDLMDFETWRTKYTMHRRFKTDLAQDYAGRFEQLSVEQGGDGNEGNVAHRISNLWFKRDVGLGVDQAAEFTRSVCQQMRAVTSVVGADGGPDHTDYQPGSMEELAMGYAYESCKYAVGLCRLRDFSHRLGFITEEFSNDDSIPQVDGKN